MLEETRKKTESQPGGHALYNVFANVFQANGFSATLPSAWGTNGPFSIMNPKRELQPGPPAGAKMSGSGGNGTSAQTLKPHNQRVRCRIPLAFSKPVKQILARRLIDSQVTAATSHGTIQNAQRTIG
jgi:hypothetical protein